MNRQVGDVIVENLVGIADQRITLGHVGLDLDAVDQCVNLRVALAPEVIAAVGATLRIDGALQGLQ